MNKKKNTFIIISLLMLTIIVLFAPLMVIKMNTYKYEERSSIWKYKNEQEFKLTDQMLIKNFLLNQTGIKETGYPDQVCEDSEAQIEEKIRNILCNAFNGEEEVMEYWNKILFNENVSCESFKKDILIEINGNPVALKLKENNFYNDSELIILFYEERTGLLIRGTFMGCDIESQDYKEFIENPVKDYYESKLGLSKMNFYIDYIDGNDANAIRKEISFSIIQG